MNRVLVIILGLCGVFDGRTAEHLTALAGVAPKELASRAGRLLGSVAREEQIKVAVEIVEFAHRLPDCDLPVLVAALAAAAPATAPAVAGRCCQLRATNAVGLARAAAKAAPGYADRIVFTVCTNVPAQFRAVAIQVDRVAPGSPHSIVVAVTEALPELRPYVERAKTLVQEGAGRRPSLAILLNETVELIEAEVDVEAGQYIERLFRR